MDRRKLEGHGGESVDNYTYRRMIHPYLLPADKYLMTIQVTQKPIKWLVLQEFTAGCARVIDCIL